MNDTPTNETQIDHAPIVAQADIDKATLLGRWHWYFGTDETDDIMSGMWDSREEVIAQGREAMGADSFYIIEGRTNAHHEYEICNGEREFAPFAETRNGEWIEPIRAAQNKALTVAATNLYMAGRWTCDAPVDEAGLWIALRDALDLPEGTETNRAALAKAGGQ